MNIDQKNQAIIIANRYTINEIAMHLGIEKIAFEKLYKHPEISIPYFYWAYSKRKEVMQKHEVTYQDAISLLLKLDPEYKSFGKNKDLKHKDDKVYIYYV